VQKVEGYMLFYRLRASPSKIQERLQIMDQIEKADYRNSVRRVWGWGGWGGGELSWSLRVVYYVQEDHVLILSLYIYIHTHTHTHTHTHMYIHTHVCACVCAGGPSICVSMYTHTHTHTHICAGGPSIDFTSLVSALPQLRESGPH
jgi:hypothetical protein